MEETLHSISNEAEEIHVLIIVMDYVSGMTPETQEKE